MRSRPVRSGGGCPGRFPSAGYTLVEVLIATTLALMLMAAVAQMFAQLGTSVNNSRATLETADRLRACQLRLQMDIEGLTVTMLPSRRVENEEGYLEYREGGAHGTSALSLADGRQQHHRLQRQQLRLTTVQAAAGGRHGGRDRRHPQCSPAATATDHSAGMYNGKPQSSRRRPRSPGSCAATTSTGGCCWSCRGCRLAAPGIRFLRQQRHFRPPLGRHERQPGGQHARRPHAAGMPLRPQPDAAFPYTCYWGALGLPTLRDVGTSAFDPGGTPSPQSAGQMDYWSQSQPFKGINGLDPVNGPVTGGAAGGTCTRTDDLILTNVIGFDVKAWDPGRGPMSISAPPRPPRETCRLRPKHRRSRRAA